MAKVTNNTGKTLSVAGVLIKAGQSVRVDAVAFAEWSANTNGRFEATKKITVYAADALVAPRLPEPVAATVPVAQPLPVAPPLTAAPAFTFPPKKGLPLLDPEEVAAQSEPAGSVSDKEPVTPAADAAGKVPAASEPTGVEPVVTPPAPVAPKVTKKAESAKKPVTEPVVTPSEPVAPKANETDESAPKDPIDPPAKTEPVTPAEDTEKKSAEAPTE